MTRLIDISSYQHAGGAGIDFARVHAEAPDIAGFIIKISQGTSYVNPYFQRDATAAIASGFEVSGYHFYDPNDGAPDAQARWFHQGAGAMATHLSQIADDAEIGSGDQTGVHLTFMETAESLFGLPPERDLFYSYQSWFAEHLNGDARLAKRLLWEAVYGRTSPPPPPRPWDKVTLWQDRSNLLLPGIVGPVDEDIAQLAAGLAGLLPTAGLRLAQPVCGVAAMPGGGPGLAWLVARDGGVFGSPFYGSLGAMHLNQPIVGIAATSGGRGYWLVGADGGVFAFGDATFHGSVPALQRAGTVGRLNAPIIGIAARPGGGGYWLAAADGGVFAFGDAPFDGSEGGKKLNAPVVGIAAHGGGGYWLAGADGGLFTFGDAPFQGSEGNVHLNAAVVAIAASPSLAGYLLIAADGGVFRFGDAPFDGSAANIHLNAPMCGGFVTASGQGYCLVAQDGGTFNYGDAHVPSLVG